MSGVLLGLLVALYPAVGDDSKATRCRNAMSGAGLAVKSVDYTASLPQVPRKAVSLADAMAGGAVGAKTPDEKGSTSVALAMGGNAPGVYVKLDGVGGGVEHYFLPTSASALMPCGAEDEHGKAGCVTGPISRGKEPGPRKVFVRISYSCKGGKPQGASSTQVGTTSRDGQMFDTESRGACSSNIVAAEATQGVEFETAATTTIKKDLAAQQADACDLAFQRNQDGNHTVNDATVGAYTELLAACSGYSPGLKAAKCKPFEQWKAAEAKKAAGGGGSGGKSPSGSKSKAAPK